MDIKTTKRTLIGLPPKKSVLLKGRHGLGKSQVVAQTAAESSQRLGKPFRFIDIRLSQREVGDLIGMPRGLDSFQITRTVFQDGKPAQIEETMNHVTVHDLPFWFPTDPDSCGFLFLDELDRATREVQQAAFELVLDYRMNFHELPIGWRVISAINEDQDVYSVLGMDPALQDRFLEIKFNPTVPEWLEYAKSTGVHDAIVKYVTKFTKDLDTPENMEPGKRYPSRRSWVNLSETIRHMTDNGDDVLRDADYLTLLSKGYVGETVAVNFVDYVLKDYRVFSAKEILNNFPKLKEDFEKMIVTDLAFYNNEIVEYISKEKVKLNKKQSENLLKYYQTIPKEAAAGFWGEFSKQCREEATKWFATYPEVKKYTNLLLQRA